MAYSFCFSLGGNLEFPIRSKNSSIELQTHQVFTKTPPPPCTWLGLWRVLEHFLTFELVPRFLWHPIMDWLVLYDVIVC